MQELINNNPQGFILLFLVAALLYFVPSLVANGRKNRNTQAIFIINLLLGWTYVGWVVAMVWAVYKERLEDDGSINTIGCGGSEDMIKMYEGPMYPEGNVLAIVGSQYKYKTREKDIVFAKMSGNGKEGWSKII